MSWFEVAIIAFITASIGYVVWRGGAANPIGTGSLERKVSKLDGAVTGLSGRVGHIEQGLSKLEESAASTKDIARIEERIETVRAEMAGHKALSETTNRNVDRIYRILLDKALGK